MVSAVGSASWPAFGSWIPGSGTFFYWLTVTGERIYTKYWLTASEGLPRNSVELG